MAKIRAIKTSFTGGEISKQLYGRVDLESFIASNKQLYNVLPTIYGSALNRGGTEFVDSNISFYDKRLQEISDTYGVSCVSVDWSFSHYVFGCSGGRIIRCDFDFTNIVVKEIVYGGQNIGNILSVSQTGWWSDRNVLRVSTDSATYTLKPSDDEWTSFDVTQDSSNKEVLFDLAPYTSGSIRNNGTSVGWNGKSLIFYTISVAGTYTTNSYDIDDSDVLYFSGFFLDNNNFLLAKNSSLFWFKNGTVVSLGQNVPVPLGASLQDGNICVYVDKQISDGEYGICGDYYDAQGTLLKEVVFVKTDTFLAMNMAISVEDKVLFVGTTACICMYRGAIFYLGFTVNDPVGYIVNSNKQILICNGSSGSVTILSPSYDAGNKKRVLVPFKVNKKINYIVEFGDRVIRFYKNRKLVTDGVGNPYEILSPYSINDLVDDEGKLRISYIQNVDVLYICHKDFPIQALKRYGDADWVLEEFTLTGGPFGDANTDTNQKLTSNVTEGIITINAVDNSSSVTIYTDRNKTTLSDDDRESRLEWYLDGALIYGANYGYLTNITTQQAVNALLGTTDGANFIVTYSGNTIDVSVKDGVLTSYSGKVLKLVRYINIDVGIFGKRDKYEYSATFSASATPVDIFDDSMVGKLIRLNYIDNNTVMWESGKSITSGAIRKSGNNYYKATSSGTTGQIKPVHTEGSVSDGGVTWQYLHSGYGVGTIIEKVSASQIKVNADGYFPDFTYGTYLWELGIVGGGVYPNCCALYKERFVFSISTPNGTKICASNAGDYSNFSDNSFGDILPENAITVLLQGNQESLVLWMSALNKLYIGTACEEFVFGEQTIAEVLSPTNVMCLRVSSLGSAAIMPLHVLDELFFVSNNEKQIANFTYIAERDTFRPVNISVMFEHLLRKGVKCWAYTAEPYKTIWFADKEGNLRSVSYDADNKVCAGARHNVGGKVVSLAVIPEPNGNYDELWMVVERVVDEQTVYYTERLSWGLPQEDVTDEYKNTHGVFVDCARVFEFDSDVAAITGLYWLEGKTVKVVVDGMVQTDKVVVDGSITLDKPGKVVIVGLGYEWFIETLYLNAGANDGTAQGLPQRVSKIIARVIDTRYFTSKASEGNRMDIVCNEPVLTDGDFEIHLPSDYSKTMTMFFKSDKPLSCCILMFVKEMQTYQ